MPPGNLSLRGAVVRGKDVWVNPDYWVVFGLVVDYG